MTSHSTVMALRVMHGKTPKKEKKRKASSMDGSADADDADDETSNN